MGPGSVNFGSTVLPKTTVSPPLPSALLGGFLFFLHSLECPLSSHHPGSLMWLQRPGGFIRPEWSHIPVQGFALVVF